MNCLLFIGYGPLFGSLVSKSGFRAGSFSLCSVLVMGGPRLKPGFPQHWIFTRFCLVLVVISCMLWLLMLLSLLTRLTGLFWTALLGAWDYPLGFGRFIFLFIIKSDFGLIWLRDWLSLGVGMGGSLRVASQHGLHCGSVCTLV